MCSMPQIRSTWFLMLKGKLLAEYLEFVVPYTCRLLRHDLNSWTVSTLFPLWHCIIFPSLCNAELHIISLGKTKHNHHSHSHPIVSCMAPQQTALCQSEAPGSQILGSLVWASHRNTFSSFRTTKVWGQTCVLPPSHLPTWMTFPWTKGPDCNGKNMVSQWLCSHGCKINFSVVMTVSPKIFVLCTSLFFQLHCATSSVPSEWLLVHTDYGATDPIKLLFPCESFLLWQTPWPFR